jgi:hypothetical protein
MLRVLITMIPLLCAAGHAYSQTTDRDQFRAAVSRSKAGNRTAVEVNLAKNGNSYAQKKILCDVEYASDPAVRQESINSLRQTGGWYAILAFSTFLSNTPLNTSVMAPNDRRSDVRFLGRRYYAMKFLPEVVPNSPFNVKDTELVSRPEYWAVQWGAWIRNHQSELSLLQPRGLDRSPDKQECSRDFGRYKK